MACDAQSVKLFGRLVAPPGQLFLAQPLLIDDFGQERFASTQVFGALPACFLRSPHAIFRLLPAKRRQVAFDPLKTQHHALFQGQKVEQIGHASVSDQFELFDPNVAKLFEAVAFAFDESTQDVGVEIHGVTRFSRENAVVLRSRV
jgi:hypothetical protein